ASASWRNRTRVRSPVALPRGLPAPQVARRDGGALPRGDRWRGLRPSTLSPAGEAGRGQVAWGGIVVPWHLLACAFPVRDWRRAKDDAEATDRSEGDSVLPADPDAPSTRSIIVGLP